MWEFSFQFPDVSPISPLFYFYKRVIMNLGKTFESWILRCFDRDPKPLGQWSRFKDLLLETEWGPHICLFTEMKKRFSFPLFFFLCEKNIKICENSMAVFVFGFFLFFCVFLLARDLQTHKQIFFVPFLILEGFFKWSFRKKKICMYTFNKPSMDIHSDSKDGQCMTFVVSAWHLLLETSSFKFRVYGVKK